METKIIQMLLADEGKWLTEAAEVEDRVFCRRVFNARKSDWTEWTNEQKEAWEKARAALE